MKYAVVSCINGNYKIESEHGENLTGAKMAWHEKCRSLENEPTVITATVAVVDENYSSIGGFYEHITHEVQVQTEE